MLIEFSWRVLLRTMHHENLRRGHMRIMEIPAATALAVIISVAGIFLGSSPTDARSASPTSEIDSGVANINKTNNPGIRLAEDASDSDNAKGPRLLQTQQPQPQQKLQVQQQHQQQPQPQQKL